MADPLEPTVPATRDISPITQKPSPKQTKSEDEEITIAALIEAEVSFSISTRKEDSECISGFQTERSASPSPPAGDKVADTSTDISSTNVQTRCVMNFLEPRPGQCDSSITNDDRHYISNFFGRNKSCSTSIPDDFYQVLCRKCMQAMKYRLKSGEGATEIQVQVAAIKHVLKNMAASGKWIHMEAQLNKAEYDRRQDPGKYDEDLKKFNNDVMKSREEAKQTGEKVRRRNTKKSITPVPDWLAEMVVRNNKDKKQEYTTVHGRDPTRWPFKDLIALIDMIGENCEVLPNIECLPVTKGELDKANLVNARTYRREANEVHEDLLKDVADAKSAIEKDPRNIQLQEDLQTFQKGLAKAKETMEDAEEELEKWLEMAAASEHTIPVKRETLKKSCKKGESSKTAAKKGKKRGKTTETGIKDRGSQDDTLTDPDVRDETRAETLSDHEMRDADSPSPPPGWKGKGKALAVSDPKTTSSKRKNSKACVRKSSVSKPPPSTSSRQSQEMEEAPAATPNVPSTPPPNPANIPLPVTPNQPTSVTPTTSTTRSTGRRLQIMAEREREQTQTAGVKREAEDQPEQQQQGGATERGSPTRKKFRQMR